jgi:hypothetical protein
MTLSKPSQAKSQAKPSLAKPSLAMAKVQMAKVVQAFAEGTMGNKAGTAGTFTPKMARKTAPSGHKSGLVPVGDVRLTVNIRDDVHQALKIRAVQERTTWPAPRKPRRPR